MKTKKTFLFAVKLFLFLGLFIFGVNSVHAASGSISASPSTCTIPINSSTCGPITISGTGSASTGTLFVDNFGASSTDITSGTPFSYTMNVPYGSSKFKLQHTAYWVTTNVDTTTVVAACDAVSIWDGSKCAANVGTFSSTGTDTYSFNIYANPVLPTGTISATNCTVPIGSSGCQTNLALTDVENTSVAAVYLEPTTPMSSVYDAIYYQDFNYAPFSSSSINSDLIGSSAPTWGGKEYSFITPASPATYDLYDVDAPVDTDLSYHGADNPPRDGYYKISSVTATATCATGSTWNGTKCVLAPTLTIKNDPARTASSSTNCGIQPGFSSCNVYVSATVPDTSVFADQSDLFALITSVASPYLPFSSSPRINFLGSQNNFKITDQKVSINYGTTNFGLFDDSNGKRLALDVNAQAMCDRTNANGNNEWVFADGKCEIPTPTATINATGCTITTAGAGSCMVEVVANIEKALTPKVYYSGSSSAINGSQAVLDWNANLGYGTNGIYTFTAQDGTTVLATSTATVSCGGGLHWNSSHTSCIVTHNECQNNACVVVAGTGKNKCTYDANCIGPIYKHYGCNATPACVVLSGSSSDYDDCSACPNYPNCKRDWLKDGDETGIDCGGTLCPVCSKKVPTFIEN